MIMLFYTLSTHQLFRPTHGCQSLHMTDDEKALLASLLPARIRAARAGRGWTQADLADRLGVHMRTIHNWESGWNIPPRRLRALVAMLDLSLEIDPLTRMRSVLRDLDRIREDVAAIIEMEEGRRPPNRTIH